MSYDIYLNEETVSGAVVEVGYVGNHTSNTVPMWRKALGFRLAEMANQRAGDCIPHLRRALFNFANPATRDEYTLMNPPNGWGSVGTAEGYLRGMLECCEEHPHARVEISR